MQKERDARRVTFYFQKYSFDCSNKRNGIFKLNIQVIYFYHKLVFKDCDTYFQGNNLRIRKGMMRVFKL